MKSVTVYELRRKGQRLGFAWVTCMTVAEAEKAFTEMHPDKIAGCVIVALSPISGF